MPSKKNDSAAVDATLPAIPKELLDQFVTGPMTAESVEAVMRQIKKAIIEQALSAGMTHHLGYEFWGTKPEGVTNHRNGSSGKTVLTDDGPLRIDVPRDRNGEFEPQLIGNHERRFTGFDDKILSMYARGMSVRKIQAHLREMYAVDISADLISSVTDAVMAEVGAWQSRQRWTFPGKRFIAR